MRSKRLITTKKLRINKHGGAKTTGAQQSSFSRLDLFGYFLGQCQKVTEIIWNVVTFGLNI